MGEAKRKALRETGRGAVDKTVVRVGDWASNRVAARHNLRERDAIDIMSAVTGGMGEKRPRYRELVADNGLSSGARA